MEEKEYYKMENEVIRIIESQLKDIVSEIVQKILDEGISPVDR